MAQKFWQMRRRSVSPFWIGFILSHVLLFGSVVMADGPVTHTPWFDSSETSEQGPEDSEDKGDFNDLDVSGNEIDPSDLDREGDFSGSSSRSNYYFSPFIPKNALPSPPSIQKK